MTKSNETSRALCLASHSPRRRLLLESLGVSFFVRTAGEEVEEIIQGQGRGGSAEVVALERARVKGLDVKRQLSEDSSVGIHPILSADTIVHLGSEILDKPRDPKEAESFLYQLSGREHGVVSAVWLCFEGREIQVWRRTIVQFIELSPELIAAYIQTGEPFDKAGGYGIQGVGGTLVQEIRGCYYTVMGLPLRETSQLLSQAKIPWALHHA